MRIFSYILYIFCQTMWWHNECVTRELEARNFETPRMLYGCCITSLATPTPHQLQQNKDAHIFLADSNYTCDPQTIVETKDSDLRSPYWSRVNRPRYFSYCTMIWAYIIHLLIARLGKADCDFGRSRALRWEDMPDSQYRLSIKSWSQACTYYVS